MQPVTIRRSCFDRYDAVTEIDPFDLSDDCQRVSFGSISVRKVWRNNWDESTDYADSTDSKPQRE